MRVITFSADYVQDGAIAVSVIVSDDGEEPIRIDGGAMVSLAEWHRLELLAREPIVKVETGAKP